MSLLDVDHGLETSNEWGQFVDIEATTEAKNSRQSRFLSLFRFYNNGHSSTPRRRQQPSVSELPQGQQTAKDLAKQDVVEHPHEDSDYEDDDDYDSDSSTGDSEEDVSDTEESTKRTSVLSPAHLKQNNASTIMKKLYRSVSINKSKRSTVILPENVLEQNLESKQSNGEDCESTADPIEIVRKACIKDEPQCVTCSCKTCLLAMEVPTCKEVAARTLDVATENQRKISLSLSEAADILVALHPKASKDQNIAKKLKIQFERADENKQRQVVARLPRDKLISILSSIRAQN